MWQIRMDTVIGRGRRLSTGRQTIEGRVRLDTLVSGNDRTRTIPRIKAVIYQPQSNQQRPRVVSKLQRGEKLEPSTTNRTAASIPGVVQQVQSQNDSKKANSNSTGSIWEEKEIQPDSHTESAAMQRHGRSPRLPDSFSDTKRKAPLSWPLLSNEYPVISKVADMRVSTKSSGLRGKEAGQKKGRFGSAKNTGKAHQSRRTRENNHFALEESAIKRGIQKDRSVSVHPPATFQPEADYCLHDRLPSALSETGLYKRLVFLHTGPFKQQPGISRVEEWLQLNEIQLRHAKIVVEGRYADERASRFSSHIMDHLGETGKL